jgi:hypothetical protein
MTAGVSHSINNENELQSAEKWHDSGGSQLAGHVVSLQFGENSHKRTAMTLQQLITKHCNNETTMADHKWSRFQILSSANFKTPLHSIQRDLPPALTFLCRSFLTIEQD